MFLTVMSGGFSQSLSATVTELALDYVADNGVPY